MRRHRPPTWLRRIIWKVKPRHPAWLLFEQQSRERRARVMRLYAESTFDVDNGLKDWLEKSGPDKKRTGP
jgi:hypothetical protein